jgi:hypothetical protein
MVADRLAEPATHFSTRFTGWMRRRTRSYDWVLDVGNGIVNYRIRHTGRARDVLDEK